MTFWTLKGKKRRKRWVNKMKRWAFKVVAKKCYKGEMWKEKEKLMSEILYLPNFTAVEFIIGV